MSRGAELVDKLAELSDTQSWKSSFREFAGRRAHLFVSLDEDETFEPEVMEAFKEYESLYEADLRGFIEQEGHTEQQFYEICCKVAADDDSDASSTLQFVLAALDFRTFVDMMRSDADTTRNARMDAEDMGF